MGNLFEDIAKIIQTDPTQEELTFEQILNAAETHDNHFWDEYLSTHSYQDYLKETSDEALEREVKKEFEKRTKKTIADNEKTNKENVEIAKLIEIANDTLEQKILFGNECVDYFKSHLDEKSDVLQTGDDLKKIIENKDGIKEHLWDAYNGFLRAFWDAWDDRASKEKFQDVFLEKYRDNDKVEKFRAGDEDVEFDVVGFIAKQEYNQLKANYKTKVKTEKNIDIDANKSIVDSVGKTALELKHLSAMPTEDEVREDVKKRMPFKNFSDFYSVYSERRFASLKDEAAALLTELEEKGAAHEQCQNIRNWMDLAINKHPNKKYMADASGNMIAVTNEVPVDDEDNPYAVSSINEINRDYYTKVCMGLIEDLMAGMENKAGKVAKEVRLNNNKKLAYQQLDIGADLTAYETAQKLYSKMNSLSAAAESKFDGELEIPNVKNEKGELIHLGDKGTQTVVSPLDGKKVHFINASQRTVHYVGGAHRDWFDDAPLKAEDQAQEDEKYYQKDMSQEPLFPEEPTEDQVAQGALGDCYMLAALAATAQQDPNKIKEAMKDNWDGTVTVRFFNDNKEPVYVTVDKSIPREKSPSQKLLNITDDVYARNTLWVQLMEKAYAASGLHKKKSFEAEEKNRDIFYGDIDVGGETYKFLPYLIEDVSKTGDRLKSTSMKHFKNNKGEYTSAEKDFFNDLQEKIKGDYIVTASTYPPKNKKDKVDLGNGLYKLHAYSVVGVEEENGKYMIKYRNPHAGEGALQSAEDGTITKIRQNGYGKLELREFSKYFDNVYSNKYDLSPMRREARVTAADLKSQYGEVIGEIQKALENSDNIFMAGLNSKSFKAFKKAAGAVNSMMQERFPDGDAMKKALDDLFTAATDYETYCENEKRIDIKTATPRALERYRAAKVTKMLKDIYTGNESLPVEARIPCDFDKLAKETKIAATGYERFCESLQSSRDMVESLRVPDAENIMVSNLKICNEIKNGLRSKSFDTFDVKSICEMKPRAKSEFFRKHTKELQVLAALANESTVSKMEEVRYFQNEPGLKAELIKKQPEFKEMLTAIGAAAGFETLTKNDKPDAIKSKTAVLVGKVNSAKENIAKVEREMAQKGNVPEKKSNNKKAKP